MDRTNAVFAHAGTSRQHNHVRALPTACDFVQIVESGRHTTHPIFVVPRRFDVFQGLLHHRPHALIALTDVALGDLEQLRLRFVQQIEHVGRFVVGLFDDGVGHANQLPLNVLLAQ